MAGRRRKKANALEFWYSILSKNKDFNNGNSLRITEQEDISPYYFSNRGSFAALKYVILVTFHKIYRTSKLSFGGCLQESKPTLRYVLDECLNVWINEEWENLRLYHMENNAPENNYKINVFVTVKTC